jgi:hypothetical protein
MHRSLIDRFGQILRFAVNILGQHDAPAPCRFQLAAPVRHAYKESQGHQQRGMQQERQ